jgi:hypothetical protein
MPADAELAFTADATAWVQAPSRTAGLLAIRKPSRNGILGNAEGGTRTVQSKVKPGSPHDRFVIAYHSPGKPSKLDCHSTVQRKGETLSPFDGKQSFLSSPVRLCLNAKNGFIREFRRETRLNFSAVQTVWRRVRDSNPRYPLRYAGFQDRCHQPLGQLSAGGVTRTSSLLVSLQQGAVNLSAPLAPSSPVLMGSAAITVQTLLNEIP